MTQDLQTFKQKIITTLCTEVTNMVENASQEALNSNSYNEDQELTMKRAGS